MRIMEYHPLHRRLNDPHTDISFQNTTVTEPEKRPLINIVAHPIRDPRLIAEYWRE